MLQCKLQHIIAALRSAAQPAARMATFVGDHLDVSDSKRFIQCITIKFDVYRTIKESIVKRELIYSFVN